MVLRFTLERCATKAMTGVMLLFVSSPCGLTLPADSQKNVPTPSLFLLFSFSMFLTSLGACRRDFSPASTICAVADPGPRICQTECLTSCRNTKGEISCHL